MNCEALSKHELRNVFLKGMILMKDQQGNFVKLFYF